MIRVRALLATATLASILVLQCGNSGTEPGNPPINGKWRWVRTCGGFNFGCTYPDADHPSRTIWFFGDSSYVTYADGLETYRGIYHLYFREVAPSRTAEVISFYSQPDPFHIVEFRGEDTLVLSDPGYDGFTDVYHKVWWEF